MYRVCAYLSFYFSLCPCCIDDVTGVFDRYLSPKEQLLLFTIVCGLGCGIGVLWNFVDARDGYTVNKIRKANVSEHAYA